MIVTVDGGDARGKGGEAETRIARMEANTTNKKEGEVAVVGTTTAKRREERRLRDDRCRDGRALGWVSMNWSRRCCVEVGA